MASSATCGCGTFHIPGCHQQFKELPAKGSLIWVRVPVYERDSVDWEAL